MADGKRKTYRELAPNGRLFYGTIYTFLIITTLMDSQLILCGAHWTAHLLDAGDSIFLDQLLRESHANSR